MTLGKLRMIGCFEVAFAAFIWGSDGIIINLVPLPSHNIAFFRVFFATITISIGFLISRKLDLFKTDFPIKKLFTLGIVL